MTGDFAEVEGDEVLLRQAFSNLCRNALEACADAHVVPRVTVAGDARPHAGHAADHRDRQRPRRRARRSPPTMFRPFFTTKARGTGLGLALVQKIIVTHNGRVSAVNADGGGARLTVDAPVPRADPSIAASTTSRQNCQRASKTAGPVRTQLSSSRFPKRL